MADDREHARFPLVPILTVLLLVAAYPLSIGPVCWLVEAGYVAHDNPFWTAFYTPLSWLVRMAPPLEQWIMSYLELWMGEL